MAKNEKTSKEVARIAAEVLNWLHEGFLSGGRVYVEHPQGDLFLIGSRTEHVTVGQLKALAASCLTQTPDKPKPRKGK